MLLLLSGWRTRLLVVVLVSGIWCSASVFYANLVGGDFVVGGDGLM